LHVNNQAVTRAKLLLEIYQTQINEIELPKLLSDIIINRDSQIKESFQEFLQRARLSSHMRILAKNK